MEYTLLRLVSAINSLGGNVVLNTSFYNEKYTGDIDYFEIITPTSTTYTNHYRKAYQILNREYTRAFIENEEWKSE